MIVKTVVRPETEMKNSGIDWISSIPKDWKIPQVRNFFEINRGRVIAKTEINELYKEGLFPVYSSQTKDNGCMGYIDSYDFEKEGLTWTTDGAYAGTVFYRKGKYNCTNVCGILTLKDGFDVSVPFCKYSIGWSAMNCRRADINGYKIMSNEMAAIKFVMPPLVEQQAIAGYLDEICSQIDEIIAEAKASIDEYKKLRIAAVNDAVTHGIHNNAIKDSNVDWIGKIPDNWKIIITKRLFKIKKDIAGKEGYTVLSITQKGIVPKVFGGKGQFAADYSNYQLVNKGDFAMNHMDLLTGWLDISEYDGVTSPDYRVFVPTGYEDIYAPYYKYVMQNCYSCRIYYGLGHGVAGMGRWRLPADMFLNFKLPMPPKAEQKEIVEFLDKRTKDIDSLIAEKESLINDLEAYKKSLIYEVVTGKRRVV